MLSSLRIPLKISTSLFKITYNRNLAKFFTLDIVVYLSKKKFCTTNMRNLQYAFNVRVVWNVVWNAVVCDMVCGIVYSMVWCVV